MSFQEEIKNTRKKTFLTQEQFAIELGVSFATINRWESGKTRPNLTAMKSIKEYCIKNNVPYESLETEWLRNE